MEFALTSFVGIIIGSFLNVVIYRLPIMLLQMERTADDLLKKKFLNLVLPASHCPSCKQVIDWIDNFPLLSFLVLRGKCKKCKAKIAWRYPLVELLSGGAAVFAVYSFGFNMQALAAAVFAWFLIAMIFIDIETQLLPDQLTIVLLWLGLIGSAFGFFILPENAIIGAAAGYISLWSAAKLFKLIRGIPGMGYGDFKLLAALGAWLGWQMLPFVLLAASFSGAIISIFLVFLKKKPFSQPVPFGPYLAVAGWLMFFWGNDILNLYLRFVSQVNF